MRLLKREFFNTEKNQIGHVSTYEKSDGNIYMVYFLEERYFSFQEYSCDGRLLDEGCALNFQMLELKEERLWI